MGAKGGWDAVLRGSFGHTGEVSWRWDGSAVLPMHYPWLTLLDSQLCSGAQDPSLVNVYQSHHLNRNFTS